MGYRIEYGPEGAVMHTGKNPDRHLLGMTLGFFMLFCSVASGIWPETWQRAADYLIPGDPAVTRAAFMEMTQQLKQGESPEEAAAAFCRTVVNGTENSD